MLQPVCQDAERECFGFGDRIGANLTVREHAWQFSNVRYPSTVNLLFGLDLHGSSTYFASLRLSI